MSSLEALLCVLGTNVEERGRCGQILEKESYGYSTGVVNVTNSLGGRVKTPLPERKGLTEAAGPGLERLAV